RGDRVAREPHDEGGDADRTERDEAIEDPADRRESRPAPRGDDDAGDEIGDEEGEAAETGDTESEATVQLTAVLQRRAEPGPHVVRRPPGQCTEPEQRDECGKHGPL